MQDETSTIEASLQLSHSSPATTLQVIDIISDCERTFAISTKIKHEWIGPAQ